MSQMSPTTLNTHFQITENGQEDITEICAGMIAIIENSDNLNATSHSPIINLNFEDNLDVNVELPSLVFDESIYGSNYEANSDQPGITGSPLLSPRDQVLFEPLVSLQEGLSTQQGGSSSDHNKVVDFDESSNEEGFNTQLIMAETQSIDRACGQNESSNIELSKTVPSSRLKLLEKRMTTTITISKGDDIELPIKRRFSSNTTTKGKRKKVRHVSEANVSRSQPSRNLDRLNTLALVDVNNLVQITSIKNFPNIVRPCYSLAHNKQISSDDFRYYNFFSTHYVDRVRRQGRILQCTFNSTASEDVGEIHRVLAHVKFKQKTYYLVEYVCLINPDNDRDILNWEFHHLGEISWQRAENLRNYKHLKSYSNIGFKYFFKMKLRFTEKDKFDSRGRKGGLASMSGLLPDLSIELSEDIGLSMKILNHLVREKSLGLDVNPSFRSQFVLFGRFIAALKSISHNPEIVIYDHLVGLVSCNDVTQNLFNHSLPQDIPAFHVPNSVARFIEEKSNCLIIVILISYNKIIQGTGKPNRHSSVGIFKKINGLEYFHFDPAQEEKSYFSVVSTMTNIRASMRSLHRKRLDIKRSYGKQVKEKDCFIQSLRYVCLLKEKYDFEHNQNWVSDKVEKLMKKRLIG